MIDSTRPADVDFMTMILALIDAQREGIELADRRDVARRPYKYIQLVAPFNGQRMPSQHEYQPVRCHDLSPGGFSFYSPRKLRTSQVIIALGVTPFSFFAAQVVRQEDIEKHDEDRVRIGCKFLKRIT